MILTSGDYEFDDDPQRVDLEVVCQFLVTEAYWGSYRTEADIRKQHRGAWRVVGAYDRATGEMVGYCRAVSDDVAVAYLGDVFVLSHTRGRGVGKELVAFMIDKGPGANFRWLLHTRDAFGLYRQFGFTTDDEHYMVRQHRFPETR